MINKCSTLFHISPVKSDLQVLTARRFRLKATGMTGGVNTGMIRIGRGMQSGFTLLEMVLVLFLIGLMASATLMLTENVEDQAKYDETKRRMEMMRKAIVGAPTRTINGGPEISGFVADMGRLPNCVRELIEQKNCADPATILSAWNINPATGIGSGWRGPYIQVIPERDKDSDGKPDLRFRDGYGTSDNVIAIDSKNSGWTFTPLIDASGATFGIDVSSASYDLTNSADDISVTPLIEASDWRINNININFINRNTSDALPTAVLGENVNLRIYLSSITDYKTGDDGSTTTLNLPTDAIPSNNNHSKLFYFDSSNAVPIGMHGYAVVCYETPAGDPDNYVLFDGDCNSASNAIPALNDIRKFNVAPRQNITLDWIIQ